MLTIYNIMAVRLIRICCSFEIYLFTRSMSFQLSLEIPEMYTTKHPGMAHNYTTRGHFNAESCLTINVTITRGKRWLSLLPRSFDEMVNRSMYQRWLQY